MKLIFLGVQGSGKSTQAKIIASKCNLPYLEMSQFLRLKSHDQDEDAKNIRNAFETGNLVSNEITIRILKKELTDFKYNNGYILDGFPRNQQQLEAIEPDITNVFYVKISDEEAKKRLQLRKREDDFGQALERRLELYHEQTEPILEKLNQTGILKTVDGERSIEEIAEDVEKIVGNEK